MNARIRDRLIHLARLNRGIISYQIIINQAELGLNLDNRHEKDQMDEILEEIGQEEHEQGRPLLNALVKVRGTHSQGDSFFKLCDRLGYGHWKELKKNPAFLKKLREDCRNFWLNEENFKKYA